MDETMETNSGKSRMNSQPTDNSKSANAAHFCTVSTEPRRRHRWQHNARTIALAEPADREQLQLF
jgi:hypothetical protein